MVKSSEPLPTFSRSSSTQAISVANTINVVHPQNSQFFAGVQPQRFISTLSPSSNTQLHIPNSSALQTGLQGPFEDNFEPIAQPMARPYRPFWLGQPAVGTSIPPAFPSQVTTSSWLQGSYFRPYTEQGSEDASRSETVHINHRLALQRDLSLGGSSRMKSPLLDPTNLTRGVHDTFITFDGKRLRVLLTKKFRNCDAGYPCRVILPKKQAEHNLPYLADKEGIKLVFRELSTDRMWLMKYKYWDNSSGRVYVLYCAKDFMKERDVEVGDSITLYEDESKNLYISYKKVGSSETETLNNQPKGTEINADNTGSLFYYWGPSTAGAREEEDEYLALLIEELKHKGQGNANCPDIL